MDRNHFFSNKYRQELCDRYMTKVSEDPNYFYHRTSNIEPILRTAQLRTLESNLQHDAKYAEPLNVETTRWGREREYLPVQAAIKKLQEEGKRTDSIFFTKGGPIDDDSYGDYIIEKRLPNPEPSNIINLIPNEYLHHGDVPLDENTTIYTPDTQEIAHLQRRYPHLNIKLREDLKAKPLPSNSYKALLDKILNRGISFIKTSADLSKMTEAALKKKVNSNAMLVGSKGLGIALPNADTDIFIPFDTVQSLKKARKELKKKYNLKESPYNNPQRNRVVLRDPSKKVDVALALKKDAEKYLTSYAQARKSLSPSQRKKIKKKKAALKDTWFFPETRYAQYKRVLNSQLGLKHF